MTLLFTHRADSSQEQEREITVNDEGQRISDNSYINLVVRHKPVLTYNLVRDY